jgi:hypothetical protein
MKKSAREFNCARCHRQVIICSSCDRGNIYCGPTCSRQAHLINKRIANKIYQKTLKGRRKHADRQRRYRQRRKGKSQKVTEQGSHDLTPNDLLSGEPRDSKSREAKQLYCRFCKKTVSPFLRHGFLRHYRDDQSPYSISWPLGP